MKKYLLKSTSRNKLNLYSDPEFAALFWGDIERDEEINACNDDLVTLDFYVGDKVELEWLGLEYVDDELVNYVEITQNFGDQLSPQTMITHRAWIPGSVLDLTQKLSCGFEIQKINSSDT